MKFLIDDDFFKMVEPLLSRLSFRLDRSGDGSTKDGTFRIVNANVQEIVVFPGPKYRITRSLISRLLLLVSKYDDSVPSSAILAMLEHYDQNDSFDQNIPESIEFDQDVLVHLFWESLRFLIFHEQAHVLNGHFTYMAENFTVKPYYSERENDEIPDIEKLLIYRVLELDADRFATASLIHYAAGGEPTAEWISRNYRILINRACSAMIAQSLLSHLEVLKSVEPDIIRRKHPTYEARVYNTLFIVESILIRSKVNKGIISSIMFDVLTKALYIGMIGHGGSGFINGISEVRLGLGAVPNSPLSLEVKAYERRYNEIKPGLDIARAQMEKYFGFPYSGNS